MLYEDVSLETKIRDLERLGYKVTKKESEILVKPYHAFVEDGAKPVEEWRGDIGLLSMTDKRFALVACTPYGIRHFRGTLIVIKNNKFIKAKDVNPEIFEILEKDKDGSIKIH